MNARVMSNIYLLTYVVYFSGYNRFRN